MVEWWMIVVLTVPVSAVGAWVAYSFGRESALKDTVQTLQRLEAKLEQGVTVTWDPKKEGED